MSALIAMAAVMVTFPALEMWRLRKGRAYFPEVKDPIVFVATEVTRKAMIMSMFTYAARVGMNLIDRW